MQKDSDLGRRFFVFFVRNFILSLLCAGWFYIVESSVDPVFLIAAVCAGVFLAFIFEKNNLRFSIAVILLVLLSFLFRYILFLVFSMSFAENTYSADMQFFLYDSKMYVTAVPSLYVWLNNFLSLRYKRFRIVELFINLPVFVLLYMFLQKNRFGMFDSPKVLLLLIALFIGAQSLLLFVYTREAMNIAGRVHYFSFFISVLPVITAGYFIFYHYAFNNGSGNFLIPMNKNISGVDLAPVTSLSPSIQLNDDLIFMVKSEDVEKGMLLRRYVLPRLGEGNIFYRKEKDSAFLPPDSISDFSKGVTTVDAKEKKNLATFYSISLVKDALVSAGNPVFAYPIDPPKGRYFNSSFKVFYDIPEYNSSKQSNVMSELPTDQYILYLKYEGSDKILKLAESITADVSTVYEMADAICNYLKTEYYYSLKPGIVGDNPIEDFLFTTKKGYCTYFATSMAVLCRSVGIPSRLAVGFVPDAYQSIMGIYPIYGRNAHSWVEVYVPGSGWLPFDPTSSVMLPDEQVLVAENDYSEFRRLAGIIIDSEMQRSELPEKIAAEENKMDKIYGLWYLIIPLIYLAIICFAKNIYLLLSFAARKPRQKVKFRFRHIKYVLSNLGIYETFSETESEFIERASGLAGASGNMLNKIHQKALYSGEFTETDLAQFYKALRGNFSLVARIIGFLKPFGVSRRGRK
jgi:transglutaminase-like putative cysteine protease